MMGQVGYGHFGETCMRSTQCAIQAVNKMAFNVEKRVTASSNREFIGFAFKKNQPVFPVSKKRDRTVATSHDCIDRCSWNKKQTF